MSSSTALVKSRVAGSAVAKNETSTGIAFRRRLTALERHADDLDALLAGDPSLWADQILRTVAAVASRMYIPSLFAQGNTDFQFHPGAAGHLDVESCYTGGDSLCR
jgi:hypothetical protein